MRALRRLAELWDRASGGDASMVAASSPTVVALGNESDMTEALARKILDRERLTSAELAEYQRDPAPVREAMRSIWLRERRWER